jgi:hypothetical protein
MSDTSDADRIRLTEVIGRDCPIHGTFHSHACDYDSIQVGCVMPTAANLQGTVVTGVEVYGPGHIPDLHAAVGKAYQPPCGMWVVLYRTRSGRTYDAWVKGNFAHRIGINWPEGYRADRWEADNAETPTR